MERLFASLFVAGLLLLGSAFHVAVAAFNSSRLPEHATGMPVTSAPFDVIPPEEAGSAPPVTVSAANLTSEAARSHSEGASSGGETIYNRRGFWTRDSQGRETRISRGPTPRLGALVPVLMYHNVRPIDFKTTNAFVSSLTLPPTEFERQLRYLKERGFSTVSMLELSEHLRGMRSLPPRPVVLTFDDGFENNYQYAFPALKRFGFGGTFYIITGLIGKTEYMSWRQAGDLARGGMEIGSHTINHPDLAHSTPAALERELSQSKKTLEDILGVTVTTLSYPSGAYSPQVVAAAARTGYSSAVTTKYGAYQSGAKPFELVRIRIQGPEELPAFRWKIEQYFPAGELVTR